MSEVVTRSTVYFDSDLHRALRVKAATTRRSISELVNEAVRQTLSEDEEDQAAFAERAKEPALTCAQLLADLKPLL